MCSSCVKFGFVQLNKTRIAKALLYCSSASVCTRVSVGGAKPFDATSRDAAAQFQFLLLPSGTVRNFKH